MLLLSQAADHDSGNVPGDTVRALHVHNCRGGFHRRLKVEANLWLDLGFFMCDADAAPKE
jgi:hypothetical protein